MILGTLAANLLANMFADNRIISAGKGQLCTNRAGQDF